MPEPGICNKKSDALVRSLLARKSFGLAGGIQNETERTLSTRTTPDLNSFVISSIQSSATLSQADRQTLLSDYFNLLNRNGAMGELLKDLFGVSPAPVPPTPSKRPDKIIQIFHLESIDSFVFKMIIDMLIFSFRE